MSIYTNFKKDKRKKIRLNSDYKNIIKYAWSIKFAVLAGIFSGIQVVLPLFMEVFNPIYFAVLSFLSAVAVVISRVIAQKELNE